MDSWLKDLRYGLRTPDAPPAHRGRDPLDRPRRGRQRRRLQPGQRPPAAAAARASRSPTGWCASTSSARASTSRWAFRCPTSAICGRPPQRLVSSTRRSHASTSSASSLDGAPPRPVAGAVVVGDYFATLGAQPALGRFFGRAEDDAHDPVVVLPTTSGAITWAPIPARSAAPSRSTARPSPSPASPRPASSAPRRLFAPDLWVPALAVDRLRDLTRGARVDAAASHRSPARGRRARAARGATGRAVGDARRRASGIERRRHVPRHARRRRAHRGRARRTDEADRHSSPGPGRLRAADRVRQRRQSPARARRRSPARARAARRGGCEPRRAGAAAPDREPAARGRRRRSRRRDREAHGERARPVRAAGADPDPARRCAGPARLPVRRSWSRPSPGSSSVCSRRCARRATIRSTGSRSRWSARVARAGDCDRAALLVVVQVALSLVLLVGGGLFLRSLDRAQAVDMGFDPSTMVALTVDLSRSGAAKKKAASSTTTSCARCAR